MTDDEILEHTNELAQYLIVKLQEWGESADRGLIPRDNQTTIVYNAVTSFCASLFNHMKTDVKDYIKLAQLHYDHLLDIGLEHHEKRDD